MFAGFVKATGDQTDAEANGFSRITGNMQTATGEQDAQGFSWKCPGGPGRPCWRRGIACDLCVLERCSGILRMGRTATADRGGMEKAARSTDGRKYPWGNTIDSCTLGNFDDESKISNEQVVGLACDGFTREAAPVESFPNGASPYGVLNMAGNVAEWVAPDFAQDQAATQVTASTSETIQFIRPVHLAALG